MKKPLLQRKTVWVLIILIIFIAFINVESKVESREYEKKQEQLAKNANKVLKGEVEIPDTRFKTKEEVTELFKAAGLNPKFVVSNFDELATSAKHHLKAGECNDIDTDQPSIKEFDYDQVGDKSGYYAKKGSTIIIEYSDHDFDGIGKKENSSNEQTTDESSTSVTTTETSTDKVVSSTNSSANDIAKLNDNWYKKDSKYATMEPIKKTVENQMEELGIDDPVRARVVNDIQSYLFELDGTETSVTNINQNLEYARTDTFIELRYNGESPTQEMAKLISDDLYSISGNRFTIQ